MSVYSVKEVLHKIRVRLYPSRLPQARGALYARTDSEAALSLEDVAAEMKNRGGFTGNYQDLIAHVRQFLDEVVYQLCDGFAVNLGYFSIHPAVGGLFKSEDESPAGHPVTFRFRSRARLREIAKSVVVEVEKAKKPGRIEGCFDLDSGETNGRLTPGGIFTLSGGKLKVAGDDPECGIYFVSALDPDKRFKVASRLAVNISSRLCGVVPAMPEGDYQIVIVSQYTVGGIPLKTPRSITSDFTVKVGSRE
jgi:hypothetical protein